MYSQDLGTEVDYKRAFELYLKSAKQSFPYAEFEVAKMYRDGIGIKVDSKLLRKLREKKIAQGHKRDDHEQNIELYN